MWDIYILGKDSSCLCSLQVCILLEDLHGRCQLSLNGGCWGELHWISELPQLLGCPQDSSRQPAQGRHLVLAGCAHSRCRSRTSAAPSVLHSTPPTSQTRNMYSSQKQSRHKVIYAIQIHRRLHLTQNSNRSSDKLRRKKLRQVEEVSDYIPSSSFWKATSSAHHRKGCLPLPTNNILLFHYLQLVLILAV